MSDEEDDWATRRVGQTLRGRYRLEAVIGAGGMGAVFRAQHVRNNDRVAVKMLHPSLSIEKKVRERFLKEGRHANNVQHPGAVRVMDDDTTEDGAIFQVMELLEGETVDGRWEKQGRRISAREVCEIAYRLLDVLAAAHDKGIFHRDIKPENVFLTRDNQLKVLDFGIARVRDDVGPSATRSGQIIGTVAFMPSEQAGGRISEIDGRTDLWAVGAVMFTLLSGKYVHEAESVQAMLVYAMTRPAPPVASVAPDVPAGIAAIIDRALAFEKTGRWPDARAMQREIGRAYALVFRKPIPGLVEREEWGEEDTELARKAGVAATVSSDRHLPPLIGASTTNPPASPGIARTVDATVVPMSQSGITIAAEPLPETRTSRPLARASTTAGVSSERPAALLARPSTASGRSKTLIGGLVGAGVIVAMAAVALIQLRHSGEPQAVPTGSALAIAPQAPAASSARPQTTTNEPPAVPAVPTIAPSALPETRNAPPPKSTIGQNPRPVVSAVPKTPPDPIRAMASTAVPAAPVGGWGLPKPDCNPAYTIGADGRHVYKPGCI